jgi:hypothetical protein
MEHGRNKIDKRIIYYILTGIFFLIITYTFAAGTCSGYNAHIHDTGLQDHAISDHVLKTITNADFGDAFGNAAKPVSVDHLTWDLKAVAFVS